ncbi:MAG TPA: 2Fe-2S iron-sulfur cluster-binding protein [Thermoanaerobaculia bacterium]|jgi:ferredoxin|nr:2Fe-2S iron-sulfur cluster-binding protein [Thermoanaerobaculia bacterium]
MRVTFFPLGTAADAIPNETVLDAARRADAPIGNSCGSVGVCGRCVVRVVAGAENMSTPTMVESHVSAQRGFAADERLACQAVVMGDVEVTTEYW